MLVYEDQDTVTQSWLDEILMTVTISAAGRWANSMHVTRTIQMWKIETALDAARGCLEGINRGDGHGRDGVTETV